MFFSSSITSREAATLCRRLGMALASGIDARTVFAREAERSVRPRLRRQLVLISDAVNRGESLRDALAGTDEGFFPTLFHELVAVGEQTGHLVEIFGRLADDYDERVRLRGMFLGAIAWPLTQLTISIVVVGLLIWIMGHIGTGQFDPLGFGLVGDAGLATYVGFLAVAGLAVAVVIYGLQSGVVWFRPIQKGVLALPGIGRALETLALARMAWIMHLTLGAGIDVRRALRLSVGGTRNARFTDRTDQIERAIGAGRPIHEALAETNVFPVEFLDAVEVGENSGRLVESMGRLAQQYHERARGAIQVLTTWAGFAVWAAIAAVIIFVIFRLFSFYIDQIYQALPPEARS